MIDDRDIDEAEWLLSQGMHLDRVMAFVVARQDMREVPTERPVACFDISFSSHDPDTERQANSTTLPAPYTSKKAA